MATIIGAEGDDTLTGGRGSDSILGLGGDDLLYDLMFRGRHTDYPVPARLCPACPTTQ